METAFDSHHFLVYRAKLDAIKQFLAQHTYHYAFDSFLTDIFGYNCTWMWHGFVLVLFWYGFTNLN